MNTNINTSRYPTGTAFGRKLSKLQKFILIQCWALKKKETPRREFLKFYSSASSEPLLPSARLGTGRFGGSKKKVPSKEDQQNIITKSLMRLIRKDLLVGFGEITKEKIFVEKVRLTRIGKREVRRLLDKQQKLPLRLKKSRKQKLKTEN